MNAPLRHPALRELPLADMRRAEDVCRILAPCMTGEALATLSAAVGMTVARLNPHQHQGALLLLVQERMEEEWRMQRDERRLPPCAKALPR